MHEEEHDESVIPRDQLLPGHAALVKLIKELGVRFITHDEETGNVFISYHDSRLDPITVVRPKEFDV